jgi:hypothetical protein
MTHPTAVPSLYILVPRANHQQFSLQMNLQRQLSPRSATESPASTPPTGWH